MPEVARERSTIVEPAAEGPARSRRRSTGVLFLSTLTIGYAVYAVDRSVLSGVLSSMSASLGLSNIEVGYLAAAQYIGVLAVVFLAGHLSDRYGRLKILLGGLVIFTAFTFLIAFSTSFWEAFSLRLVSGLGEGLFWPVAMASVATYFGGRKGFALGIFYVGFDVGTVAGPAIAGLSLSFTGDWRYAFLVAPLLGLVPIALALVQGPSFEGASEVDFRLRLGRDALDLMKRRNVKVIMVFAFLATWASVWQVVFLPFYFNKVLNYSLVYSAYLAAPIPIAGAAGKLALGRISDQLDRRLMLSSISVLAVAAYGSFFASTSLVPLILAALAMSFFSSATFPIMQSLIIDSCGGRAGTALGLSTTSQSLATVFSPIIAAYLFTLGVGKALALDALIPAALAAMVALLLSEPRPRRAPGAGVDTSGPV